MKKAKPSESDGRVVQAERFELVDPRGRVRAVLGDVGDGERFVPGLMLFDRQGLERTLYAAFPSGPTLTFNAEGNLRLQLGLHEDFPDGDDDPRYDPTAFVLLMDANGEPKAELRVHADGDVEALVAPLGPTGSTETR